MRLNKADRESLREAMPGDVLTVAGAKRDEMFSVHWSVDGQWILFHGTVTARAPDRVTERVVEAMRGDAATVMRQLDWLGAQFPLPEQESGATDFPTPRDIYWRRCLDQLPGELLESPEYRWRVALSLVRVRTGWKILCMEEVDEDRLICGSYRQAIYTDEAPEIRTLREWRGLPIGNRDGVITDAKIRVALCDAFVDPDTVSSLPDDEDEEEPEEGSWTWNEAVDDLLEWTRSQEHAAGPKPLSVEVIGLESPIQERIERQRSAR